jgi:hypothetical protein
MINSNVVLVLGAGASHSYKFPLGSEIVKSILKDGISSNWAQMIQQVGINASVFPSFQNDLRESLRTSIDAFLEVRREYEELGKAIIALWIANYENPSDLYNLDNRENWYQYLFELMIRGSDVNEFKKKKLSFVTFNYDRSLEFSLFNAIKQSLSSKKDEEAYDIFQQIAIVHLHGRIGEPFLSRGFGEAEGRGYKQIGSPQELMVAAKGIKIIYEDISKDAQFQRAHQLLKDAQSIAFLGFSYHPTNVLRLGMKDALSNPKTLTGTAKNMTASEVDKLVVPQFNFPPSSSGVSGGQFHNMNVLEFLRANLHIFY